MKKLKLILTNIMILLFLLSPLTVSATALPIPNNPASEIQSNMQNQIAAWNRGDIRSLVKSYKNADTTLYVSSTVKNGVIQGYQNILKRYLTQYPNREKMGKLSYKIIETRILSPNYAMVIGKWHLERKKSPSIGGVFTLLYENTSQGWKIVVDHTS